MILVVDSINLIFINILTIPVGNMIVSISFYVSQYPRRALKVTV